MSMAFARTNVDTSKVIFDTADLSMIDLSNFGAFNICPRSNVTLIKSYD